MEYLKKLNPRVSKRILLLIAGLVWSFAGTRVFTIGLEDIRANHGNLKVLLMFSLVVFYIFLKFIFTKMFKKHTTRIINSLKEKQCIFSFFDFKSYSIMGFMIFFGVTIRAIGVFNPIYIGTFYVGLGAALFMAGVFFLKSFISYEESKLKFAKEV